MLAAMRRLFLLPALVLTAGACAETGPIQPPVTDTTLSVVTPLLTIGVGQTQQLAAVVTTDAGDTLAAAITWVSRDPAVATVTATGLLTGQAAGGTAIVAAALGRTDSVALTVTVQPPVQPALQLVTDQVVYPVFVTAPPGDTARLFVVEKRGRVRVLRNDTLLAAPFLNITTLVSTGGEQGLLSIAFHPQYAANRYVYVSYTDAAGDTRIVRYQTSADPDVVDAQSASQVLFVDQPYGNHNGGLVAFGPDGMLYVGLGDGGDAGDPDGNGQNRATLLGSMLRLDVDAASPYAVPADNPVVGQAGIRGEIWAWGLRNPWRFSFDRATGDLYTADVGQNAREEVDVQPAASPGGENYGWNQMEGSICYTPGCSPLGLTLPVAEYTHADGCSVTGGYVYRGARLAGHQGRYFYADYCQGWVRSFTYANGQATDPREWPALSPGGQVTSFGEDARGELYVMTAAGRVYRLVAP